MTEQELREAFYRLFPVTDTDEKAASLEAFRDEASAIPSDRWVTIIEARLSFVREAPEAAIEQLAPLLAASPDDIDALFLSAAVLRTLKRFDDAIENLGKVISLASGAGDTPTLLLAYLRRAAIQARRGGEGDLERAIADYTAVIQMADAPVDQKAMALVNRGAAYGTRRGEGDVGRTIADYTAVIEMADVPVEQRAMALVNRGFAYGQRGGEGDVERRIADCTAVIEMADALVEQKAMALVNRGIAYGRRDGEGDAELAIADCDEVIKMADALVKQKANALVNRGAVYGRRGSEGDAELAIADCSAVIELANAPVEQRAMGMLNRGITYGQRGGEGDVERAIADYTTVIEMADAPVQQKAKALFNRGLAFGNRGSETGLELAVRDFTAVIESPAAVSAAYQGFAYAYKGYYLALQGSTHEANAAFREARDKVPSRLFSQLRLLAALRGYSPAEVERYEDSMEEIREAETEFLASFTDFRRDRSLLLILRQWNSFTPALPSVREQDVGGGYFLWHRGQGIVIDPGFGFLKLFHEAGGRIGDIDHIVITHAHPDHTAELESIFMLLEKYRGKQGDAAPSAGGAKKRVRLYLSQDAQRKFSPLLEVWDDAIWEVVVLNRGTLDSHEVPICDGCAVTPLAAFHEDKITKGYAVGLAFTVDCGERGRRRIVFTADTGVFKEATQATEGQKPDAEADWEHAIWKQYPKVFHAPDLLVAHIGSIDKNEFESLKAVLTYVGEVSDTRRLPGMDKSLKFYGKHLGLFGTYAVIEHLEPELALVSEFGKEMRDIRVPVLQKIQDGLSINAESGSVRRPVFCADPHFVYDIGEKKLLCHEKREFADPGGLTMDDLYVPTARGRSEDCAVCLLSKDSKLFTRERERKLREFFQALNERDLPHFTDEARKRKRAKKKSDQKAGDASGET